MKELMIKLIIAMIPITATVNISELLPYFIFRVNFFYSLPFIPPIIEAIDF